MAMAMGTQVRNRKLFVSAQEKALRVNAIKFSIDKTSDTPLCRLCNEKTKYSAHYECVFNFGSTSI